MRECLACDLASGRRPLPGGLIFATAGWRVEHCVGPLGVGTLVVKPKRHVLHVADLTADETLEMGPLLRATAAAVRGLASADQAYVCLWSHGPVHIHYVVQPVTREATAELGASGPALQAAMFTRNREVDPDQAAGFAERARTWFAEHGVEHGGREPRETRRPCSRITIRTARPGDGGALVRIHAQVAAYYADLAPQHFQLPVLDGFAAELDAEIAPADETTLHLVAECDGDVAGALAGQLLAPERGAERQIAPDLRETRLRIDYVAIDDAHRRYGVGTCLVEAAEAWGRDRGATVAETWTYHRSPLSVPFWEQRMGYEERSVNLRKRL